MPQRPYILPFIFGILALICLSIAPYLVFMYAGIEKEMGLAQKIFYYHVPSAFSMFLGSFLCFVFSIFYLWKRDKNCDLWAACSAEVSLLFGTLVLITGAIWAKPIWGAWWVWDAQLTLTLILWLILAAYHMLRTYIEDPVQKCALSRSSRHYRLPQRTLHPLCYQTMAHAPSRSGPRRRNQPASRHESGFLLLRHHLLRALFRPALQTRITRKSTRRTRIAQSRNLKNNFFTEELMQHLEYMTAAYIIIWVAILLYFLSLSKREKAIWEELRELRATITKNHTP